METPSQNTSKHVVATREDSFWLAALVTATFICPVLFKATYLACPLFCTVFLQGFPLRSLARVFFLSQGSDSSGSKSRPGRTPACKVTLKSRRPPWRPTRILETENPSADSCWEERNTDLADGEGSRAFLLRVPKFHLHVLKILLKVLLFRLPRQRLIELK